MIGHELERVLARLSSEPTEIRCAELVRLLERLGFAVRRGRRGNHRIATHDGLVGFRGLSFDCGHGRNAVVKRAYVRRIRQTLETYAEQLDGY